MSSNRILVPLLIVTTLSVDCVLVGLLSDRSAWPDILVAVLLGLAGGQINLATLWGVLGYRRLPWRLTALLVVPIGWGLAIAFVTPKIFPGYRIAAAWGVHFLTQTALLTSILLLIRFLGARLRCAELAAVDRSVRRLQFTIRYLFAWLTATAIALSVLKTTFENVKIVQVRFDWDAILILGFVNAMLGLSFAWLLLDSRGSRTRLIAAFVTLFPAACVIGWVSYVAVPDRVHATFVLWFVAVLYSSVAWVVLRVAGCRLTWPMTDNTSATSSSRD